MEYQKFIEHKTQLGGYYGFDPIELHPGLKDFQADLVTWALQKGRGAIFAGCGLGKTIMQLSWADNILRKANKPVLVLAPLAVTFQTVREAEKFGLSADLSRDGRLSNGIVVTNYEKLHLFNPLDFAGAVCDESACLKSFDAVRKNAIIEFMRKMPYRLLCSATPAPNDYVELGNSSEALGELGHIDMLNRFFKNNQNNSSTKGWYRGRAAPRMWEGKQWRFKGHAEMPFWRWVCSWARAIRKPSDLGYSDDEFILPPLIEKDHMIETVNKADDMLVALPAIGLHEQRAERKRTINERCEKTKEIVDSKNDQSFAWCHLNPEGDRLEKIIKGAVQISGRDSDDSKEDKFKRFIEGDIKVLVSKPKIGAWGLNMQNCAHVTTFADHSYESRYQLIRRFYRYGQTRAVEVDTIVTEGDLNVLENVKRKAVAADRMFDNLVSCMHETLEIQRSEYKSGWESPAWL